MPSNNSGARNKLTTSRNDRPFLQPDQLNTQRFTTPAVETQQIPTFPTPSHVNPIQPANPPRQRLSTPYSPCHPPQPNVRPSYPHPAPNTFILYSLHFCPPLTSVCFGCGNSLKPSGMICIILRETWSLFPSCKGNISARVKPLQDAVMCIFIAVQGVYG